MFNEDIVKIKLWKYNLVSETIVITIVKLQLRGNKIENFEMNAMNAAFDFVLI